jgi:hypothetical protein
MTEQLHPMVPPNILLNNWESDWFNERENVDVLLTQAYQAGADAELEACCEWLDREGWSGESWQLLAARRPKPPTLTSIALQMLGTIERDAHYLPEITNTIRRALEALPDD